jgi:hypothetical protein
VGLGATREQREAIAREWLAEVEPLARRYADRGTWQVIWAGGALVLLAGGLCWLIVGSTDWLVCGGAAWVVVVAIAGADKGCNLSGLARRVQSAARASEPGPFLREASEALFWVDRLDDCATHLPDRAGAVLLELAPPGLPDAAREALEHLSRLSTEWEAWRARFGVPADADFMDVEACDAYEEAFRAANLPHSLGDIRRALQAAARPPAGGAA